MKPNGKRAAPSSQGPSKKRKLGPSKTKPDAKKSNNSKGKEKEKPKDKAADRGIIPIPVVNDVEEEELSEQDMEVLEEYGGSAAFLRTLDQKGISRSKKETDRLHLLNKPVRVAPVDDLPSLDSDGSGDDEDEDVDLAWSSGDEDDNDMSSGDDSASEQDSDAEMPYETAPRKRRSSWEPEENGAVQRLPIKLADGRIQKTGTKPMTAPAVPESESESPSENEEEQEEELERSRQKRAADVATGARFGRVAVVDIIGNKSRKARVQGAKDQIAGICQDIVSEPENSLGLLRRLHTFSLPELSTPAHPDPVPNDIIIRKLAVLSQLAVYKDIIPGYRIRALTEQEKTEKVSQMVARTRDWEQGLVVVYQAYLRSLEVELKGRTELADIALQCMCTLAVEVTHFNFRVNLMGCIVARLSKRSWDKASYLCLNTIIRVFKEDLTGVPSLEIVRLLNRMVKEKRFNIHPEVLSCLLHLRLKTELGVRASESKIDRESPKKNHSNKKAAARRSKGKVTDQPHLSKKAKTAMKEKKEIDREMRDAEAEVDKEERAITQTETLKLLFVLYFRILKNPSPTPLLPAALQGISKYAHLVNIDFFKDLMKVLKDLISHETEELEEESTDGVVVDSTKENRNIQHRILCIVTAFELLSGQGEALNIDLSDFITRLYGIILPLSLLPDIETPPPPSFTSDVRPVKTYSVADMLFRALNIVFSPRTFGTAAPPWRSAAFAKRILTASMNWPPKTALRALDFVGGLVAKDAKLEALLSTEDRTYDGVYRSDIEDPQLCNPFGTSFWELHLLQQSHWDPRVRAEATKLAKFTRN